MLKCMPLRGAQPPLAGGALHHARINGGTAKRAAGMWIWHICLLHGRDFGPGMLLRWVLTGQASLARPVLSKRGTLTAWPCFAPLYNLSKRLALATSSAGQCLWDFWMHTRSRDEQA